MRDRDVAAWLTGTAEHINHLAADLEAAHRRARTWAKGAWLGSRTSSSQPATGTHSDPTASAALRHDGIVGDARGAERRMARITADLRWLDRYTSRYPTPTATSAPDAGCASCARIGQWEPVTAAAPRFPNAPTAPRQPVCRWCRDVTARTGHWPALEALTLHHQGRRVPETLLQQRT